jgi:hypothetical protein
MGCSDFIDKYNLYRVMRKECDKCVGILINWLSGGKGQLTWIQVSEFKESRNSESAMKIKDKEGVLTTNFTDS